MHKVSLNEIIDFISFFMIEYILLYTLIQSLLFLMPLFIYFNETF